MESLNETLLLEMAEVGSFLKYRICVYGKEGSYPHFHFYKDDPKTGGCIRLDVPEYSVHGSYTEKLNSKDRKKLVKWLMQPHKSFGKYGLTNWRIICIYWDDNNPNYLFNKEASMPDYTKLK